MRRIARELILPAMVALGLAFVIQSAIAKPYEIPTESMVPTIEAHDRVIANRLIYRFRDIRRGDIIVFSPPPAAIATCGQPAGNVPFVKRVIGLPGDVVSYRKGGPTLVNGKPLNITGPRANDTSRTFAAVPAGHILVLGDNRPNSCDSHEWGDDPSTPQWDPANPAVDPFVPIANVIGQAEVTYWPLNRVSFLN